MIQQMFYQKWSLLNKSFDSSLTLASQRVNHSNTDWINLVTVPLVRVLYEVELRSLASQSSRLHPNSKGEENNYKLFRKNNDVVLASPSPPCSDDLYSEAYRKQLGCMWLRIALSGNHWEAYCFGIKTPVSVSRLFLVHYTCKWSWSVQPVRHTSVTHNMSPGLLVPWRIFVQCSVKPH